jgi:hypothetical protein
MRVGKELKREISRPKKLLADETLPGWALRA